GIANRVDDIFRVRPDAALLRVTNSGIDRRSGGTYERPFLLLWVFGADGLMTHAELFDVDQEDEALARFDELTAAPLAAMSIENAAARAARRLGEAWEAHDWKRLSALIPAGFRSIDRQRFAQLESARDPFLEAFRPMFEMFSSSSPTSKLLGTRGDRLALFHGHWAASNDLVGPSELDWLSLLEVDERGDPAALIEFEPRDLEAAYAELDARFAAGEGARYAAARELWSRMARAFAARDWESLASLFGPDFVIDDHRLLGWGTLRSGDEYVARVRALVDLRPDVGVRLHHVLALDHRGALTVHVWAGDES